MENPAIRIMLIILSLCEGLAIIAFVLSSDLHGHFLPSCATIMCAVALFLQSKFLSKK